MGYVWLEENATPQGGPHLAATTALRDRPIVLL